MVLVIYRVLCGERLVTVLLQWLPGLRHQGQQRLRASGQEGEDMSRERDLLKKIWEDLDGDRDNYNQLCEEIEELLAQPEQEKLNTADIYLGFQIDNTNHLDETSFTAGVRFAEKEHWIGE